MLLEVVENNQYLKNLLESSHNEFPTEQINLYNEGSIFERPNGDEFDRQVGYLKELLNNTYQN